MGISGSNFLMKTNIVEILVLFKIPQEGVMVVIVW
jgi:hypothetical protein